MSAELVLELFDSFWFHSAIFSDKPASPPPPPSSSSATRSSHEGHDGDDEDDRLLLETKLSRAPTLHVRSRSDQFSGGLGLGLGSDPFSPNSVLLAATPKLETILSGKEVSDFEGERPTTKSEGETEESPSLNRGNKKSENMRRKMKKERSKSSKSLSALEFEELKGFMDLGFVFSEQDRDDSNLVSILPGLQRLGLRDDGDETEAQEKEADDEIMVPRPYLSEAWDSLGRQRKRSEDPLVNWRVTVPASGNEIAMKDHLRSWAHTVASTVR